MRRQQQTGHTTGASVKAPWWLGHRPAGVKAQAQESCQDSSAADSLDVVSARQVICMLSGSSLACWNSAAAVHNTATEDSSRMLNANCN